MVSLLGYKISDYLLLIGLNYSLVVLILILLSILVVLGRLNRFRGLVSGIVIFLSLLSLNVFDVRIAGIAFWNGILVCVLLWNLVQLKDLVRLNQDG